MSAETLLSWPTARLGEAIEALARHAKLAPSSVALTLPPELTRGDTPEVARWLEWAGTELGHEAEPVQVAVAEAESVLRQAGPALVRLRGPRETMWVLLLGRRGHALRVLGPDGRVHACPVAALRNALVAHDEAPHAPEVDRLLEAAAVPAARRARARRAMLAERLSAHGLEDIWLLRAPTTRGFGAAWASHRLTQRLLVLAGVMLAGYALELQGWRLIGGAALDGRLDMGWLAAWVLLLLTLVPLGLLAGWVRAGFALDVGRLLKQRLFAGALRLDLDEVRRHGAGQWLSRVIETQALEAQALSGGLSVIVSLLEFACAAWILAFGAAPLLHLALLAGWLLLTAALALRLHRRLAAWTLQRLLMTHGLVERMVGHRTRLAQERPARRDAQEDGETTAYVEAGRAMDAALVPVTALVPNGWVLVSFAALAPAFVGGGASAAGLAISLGGILFGHRALTGLSAGMTLLANAGVAWGQVIDLFRAGFGRAAQGPFLGTPQAARLTHGRGTAVLDAERLTYRYRPEGEAVLRGADLTLRSGDRVLLEGSSGGGKSTLAALLAGLRTPASGSLLLAGMDRPTLGEGWHRLATAAPQFHENHVLSGTLAFNLLLGREGPIGERDLAEARQLCEELGLGELLARMPAGLAQQVGGTGWQLSHGEKSRLFLARAILQRAPVTVLDESFAALDPMTLQQCLDCVLRRAPTLVVIAHP